MTWNPDEYKVPTFVPQEEPLWVGLMHTSWAVSGRVIGWQKSEEVAPFPRTDLPKPAGTRARAVVLVHATDCADPDLFGPILTIDANWRARYVGTAAEAWRAALDLAAETKAKMEASWSAPDASAAK